MRFSAGDKLGPYELLAPLGAGGMGEVWKARDPRLNRSVAVKQLTTRHASASNKGRFEQEARAVAALNHPNICQIYDVGTSPDGSGYLVLEYVEGKPLRGPIPAADAVRIALQIAGALEEAHAKGILHRDLKPGNILLTSKRDPKLLDFGLAKLLDDSDSEATKTLEGAVLGTAAYMSPEQAQGQPLDERSDIFSFGAVLYEMLSGRRAFPGEHALTALGAVIHRDPDPLQAPPDIVRIVTRCLRKSAADRFQTAAELRAALASARVSEAPATELPSVAVLPFANLSRDPDNEYFSDGLAEELLNLLARMEGVKVAGRTSSFFFKGKDVEFVEIGRRLNVGYILEGSVRKAGTRIRVSAQLVNVADGFHLWSERYDRELSDVFALQDEIAAAIAEALKLKLAPSAPRARHTPPLAAYEAYLKALHWSYKITPDSIAQAQKYFQQAIALDPQYALAYASLAEMTTREVGFGKPAREVMPRARKAALAALELDPDQPVAHCVLGLIAVGYDYDWKESERHFRLAMTANPVPPVVRMLHSAFHLGPLGRHRETLENMQAAVAQDPLWVLSRVVLAYGLFVGGMPDRALAEFTTVRELDPHFWYTDFCQLQVYLGNGDLKKALECAERASAAAPWSVRAQSFLAALLRLTGDVGRSGAILEKIRALPEHQSAIPMLFYYAVCGDWDEAADWFGRAIEHRDQTLLLTLGTPLFAPLRTHPRWPGLMKSINFPAA